MMGCPCNVYSFVGAGGLLAGGLGIDATPYALDIRPVQLSGTARVEVSSIPWDGVVAIWGLGELSAGVSGEYKDSGPWGLHGTGGEGGLGYPAQDTGLFCLSCADFSGQQFISFPEDNMSPTSAFTVSLWCRLEDFYNQRTFFSRGYQDTAGNDWVFELGYSVIGHLWAQLQTVTEDAEVVSCDCFSSVTLANDTWYHVAATWDRSALSVYINGVQRGTSATTEDTTVTPGNGSYASRFNGGGMMTGQLQDIRVYAEAKSASWLKAERDNYCSDFFTVGTEEAA